MTGIVFGKSGQVALELAGLHPDVDFFGRAAFDLQEKVDVAAFIKRADPAFVINAAAYTAVDQAEDNEQDAFAVNARAPGEMAKVCADLDIPLVHISTDYVFDGKGEAARRPEDITKPLGAYGRTKLAGEQAVVAAGGRYAILRTSWVFSRHGSNFVKTMLRLATTQNQLNVVDDQVGGPTPAAAIARVCLSIAHQLSEDANKAGIYHYTGAPETSWAKFAKEIFHQAGKSVDVTPILTADYPTPAARPLNSRLDCTSLQDVFGIPRPSWKKALNEVIKDLVN